MQIICVVLVALGAALIPFVEPACTIHSGTTSITVGFGNTTVVQCNTFRCETNNGITALYIQGQAYCEVPNEDGTKECITNGTTHRCITCHYHPNNITNPISTSRQCVSGSTCVAGGTEVDDNCGRATCNSTTYVLDFIAGSKTGCTYGGDCVTPEEYLVIQYNSTTQFNCTCQSVSANQLGCHLFQSSGTSGTSGTSGSTQDCSFVGGPTVPFGNTTVSNCNTYICETRNNVTNLYIQGQAACKLTYQNGTSKCLAAGSTESCATCHYDEANPSSPPSVTYACSFEGECVAEGQTREYHCASFQCNSVNNTLIMEVVEKTQCYFSGTCMTPGMYHDIAGHGNCTCTDLSTSAIGCYTSGSSFECIAEGNQTLSDGETISLNCNTYTCESRNGIPGLYIQGQAYCRIVHSNETESCILPNTTENCVTCHYNETNPTQPLSTTKGLQSLVPFNETILALRRQCRYNDVCVAPGEYATIDPHGNCTCKVASNNTMACYQTSSQSECTFNGATVADGDIEIVDCNTTYRCETRNGILGMYIIGEAYCKVTYVGGTFICIPAGSTESCSTCHYNAATPTVYPYTTHECTAGSSCVAPGEEVDLNCARYTCNSATYTLDLVAGSNTQCSAGSSCVEPGEEVDYNCARYTCNSANYTLDLVAGSNTQCNYYGTCVPQEAYTTVGNLGICTCVNITTNLISCYSATPCTLSNGTQVALGTTVNENCNNKTCEERNGAFRMYIQPPGYCGFSGGYCLEAGSEYYCYTCHFDAASDNPLSLTRECRDNDGTCVAPGQSWEYRCGHYTCNASTYNLDLDSKTECYCATDGSCTAPGEFRIIDGKNCTCTSISGNHISCYQLT